MARGYHDRPVGCNAMPITSGPSRGAKMAICIGQLCKSHVWETCRQTVCGPHQYPASPYYVLFQESTWGIDEDGPRSTPAAASPRGQAIRQTEDLQPDWQRNSGKRQEAVELRVVWRGAGWAHGGQWPWDQDVVMATTWIQSPRMIQQQTRSIRGLVLSCHGDGPWPCQSKALG